ncbi:nucleotide exchange factor GrpE [Corynebacterium sputi]|uniref:nucleotide exchange factor GrpE n=1 Tax=Corynebacterium sputi TaxID=489915 RepID=UPI0003FEC513|nr:nucleotide exchange factor GrpE [Corynebacterium sputi]
MPDRNTNGYDDGTTEQDLEMDVVDAVGDASDEPAEPLVDAEFVDDADADIIEGGFDEIVDEEPLDPTATLQIELDERTADLQRVTAEFANYRRRADRDKTAARESAKASFATDLLAIADDLDRAEQHGDLIDGPFKAIADKFRATLVSQKVVEFGAEGDPFNPELHEAVQDTSTGSEQVVGAVLRKGYRVGDKVIRSAMVAIADPA